MTATQRQKEYETERGIGRAAFFKLLKSLDNSGLVQKLQNPETKEWEYRKAGIATQ